MLEHRQSLTEYCRSLTYTEAITYLVDVVRVDAKIRTAKQQQEQDMKFATAHQVFGQLAGAMFVGMDTLTVVPLKGGKKNPMQGRVTKQVTGSHVQVFGNVKSNGYGNMVARRLVAEGKDPEEFVLSPLSWGERVPETCFIEHKGAFYVQVIFKKAGEVEYFLDNVHIDKVDIVGLNEVEPSEDSQGGLEDKVIVRSYKLESLVAVRANGMEWR